MHGTNTIIIRLNLFREALHGLVIGQAFHLDDLGLFPGQSMGDVLSTEFHRDKFSPINWVFECQCYSIYAPRSLMYRQEYGDGSACSHSPTKTFPLYHTDRKKRCSAINVFCA